MENIYRTMRIWRHDYHNHIQAMLALTDSPEELRQYLWMDYLSRTIYPEGLELVPRRYAISRRNRRIVSNCDILITYVNHAYGGAYAAYKLAKKAGRTVMNLGCLE